MGQPTDLSAPSASHNAPSFRATQRYGREHRTRLAERLVLIVKFELRYLATEASRTCIG